MALSTLSKQHCPTNATRYALKRYALKGIQMSMSRSPFRMYRLANFELSLYSYLSGNNRFEMQSDSFLLLNLAAYCLPLIIASSIPLGYRAPDPPAGFQAVVQFESELLNPVGVYIDAIEPWNFGLDLPGTLP